QETAVQWVSGKEWWFKTTIDWNTDWERFQHIELECPGLDPFSTLFINGRPCGFADNAFRRWSFEIKDLLHPGTNELLIKIASPQQMADSLYAQLAKPLPGGPRVTVRKPQYQFGWDFGPKLLGSGILQAIRIKSWDALDVRDCAVHTVSFSDSLAEMQLDVQYLLQDSMLMDRIELHMGDQTWSFIPDQHFGHQRLQFKFQIQKPELWWPNGSGNPHLYPTLLRFYSGDKILHEKQWKTGIRTIRLRQELDVPGTRFYFEVNGKPVFCKGSNYVPPDILYPDQKDPVDYVKIAAESNFNMLRIWGGGAYESDAFYEACDAQGIMIWQDFMYARAMYPGDSAFLLNASLEAEEQAARLARHACIALWCGNNEIEEGWNHWGWKDGLNSEDQLRIYSDYQRLFDSILPEAVKRYCPQSSYWPSSPLFGRGNPRFQLEGDAHDWGLWHDELPFEALESRIPRFMSEFGFQSLPSMASIKKFALEPDWNLNSRTMLNRQKHPRGNKLIQQYIERDLSKPKDFESLIYLNQLIQAEGISRIIRAHRNAKPYCMGSLYWQFNDCWPGISWSGVDYFGRWKALQHHVKRAFEPVLFAAEHDDEGIRVRGISDFPEAVAVQLEVIVQDFKGAQIFYDIWTDTLAANSSAQVYAWPFALGILDIRKSHYILLRWKYQDRQSSQGYFMDRLKNLELEEPQIQLESMVPVEDGYRLQLKARHFAKAVYLKEDADLAFHPNYFDLHPDWSQTVHVKTKKTGLKVEDLEILSLFDFIKK
ncbi:MAG TPA: glycoside hydrolase family 2 protein, partial [Saprospiraceae bacterium]|nr:glycoside hydrolase family 2 protein [Saprospiraceae bacterium]